MLVRFESVAWRQTRWYEYASRLVFGGVVTVLAGLVAEKFGPTLGGLFLAFPAIFPASASLIEQHEKEKKRRACLDGTLRGRRAAGVDAAGAAMGSVGLTAFAVVSWALLPGLSTWIALATAMLAWAVIAGAVWFARKRTLHQLLRRFDGRL